MNKTQWYLGAPNAVVICLREVRTEGLIGCFYHRYSPDPVPFHSSDQMTLRMEELYDWLWFPHPGSNERSFFPKKNNVRHETERKKIMSDESLLSRHGDIGTFIVRVQHRQNNSWQGRLTWMEEDKTVQFRSVWEMIKLIESAVDTVSPPEEEEPAPVWFPEEKKE